MKHSSQENRCLHWAGCTQFVHGRSRMTIGPRIPTMPGRSTSGFRQPGRYSLHQAQSAVKWSASRMIGELHPFKNRSSDGPRTLCLLSCSWMASPMSYTLFSVVATPETAMGMYYYVTASCVPYRSHTRCDAIIPLVRR